ncbi:hypothetical protein I3842_03G205100 [Carya illinoinensis]|uniref:Uncharacterized protein n=1 Tax=Carya illinoinensis TaxID=32201 RepID=A0A922JZU7_CARIL|nr:hypothetical protein I3842_03G205100 [Carya illinoinensis]
MTIVFVKKGRVNNSPPLAGTGRYTFIAVSSCTSSSYSSSHLLLLFFSISFFSSSLVQRVAIVDGHVAVNEPGSCIYNKKFQIQRLLVRFVLKYDLDARSATSSVGLEFHKSG